VINATEPNQCTRLAGLDLARALALVGMLMVHIGPTEAEGMAGRLYALPHGRAAILFMLVAGVGVSLMAARGRGATDLRLLWRALLLLPLGLGLQLPEHSPMVILPTYAVLFVLATVLIRLSTPVLLCAAVVAVLAGPTGFLLGYLQAPEVFANAPVSFRDTPSSILHGMVLSGPHPVITWLFPFLAGMLLGRLDLRDRGVQCLLVFAGILVALILTAMGLVARVLLGDAFTDAGWPWLLRTDAHSQMILWLGSATATAAAVLGVSLALAERARVWLRPLTDTGRIALSFYVGHILALAGWPDTLRSEEPAQAAAMALAITAGTAAVALIWLRILGRGPLEMLLQPPRQRGRTAESA